jgi:hypothetical protein
LTGDPILDLAVSLGGVLAIVALTFALGAFRSATVTLEAAADRLAFDEPDFSVGDWMIGADGKAAAAVSADRAETALVIATGDGLASRRFRHGAVGLEKVGAAIRLKVGEPSLGAVTLAAGDEATAEQWLLKLAGPRL